MRARRIAATDPGIAALPALNLTEVGGLETAVRALEIAAAGGHNLLLIGRAESVRTTLARLLPRLLPPLSSREAAALATVYAQARRQFEEPSRRRPFRSPNCRISPAGMVGRSDRPQPGEVSLAHSGVLFLDELGEFRADTLSALRLALDQGRVTVGTSSLHLPARFSLLATISPCSCCTPPKVEQHHGSLVGQLLERIELQVRVPRIGPLRVMPGPGWSAVTARVARAREIQAVRFGAISAPWNGAMEAEAMRRHCVLRESAEDLLAAVRKGRGLPSEQACRQVQAVARTVADLDEEPTIRSVHLVEALYFRTRGLLG